MFSYPHLLEGFKTLPVSADDSAGLSHCQLLDVRARHLKFNDYHHFQQFLTRAPADQFGDISLRLTREICARRLPDRGATYYEFIRLPDGIGFYSYWLGWDRDGDEVRVPPPIDGFATVPRLRKEVEHPVYVISNPDELAAWRVLWGATGYLPEELAKAHFKSYFERRHLVDGRPTNAKGPREVPAEGPARDQHRKREEFLVTRKTGEAADGRFGGMLNGRSSRRPARIRAPAIHFASTLMFCKRFNVLQVL